MVHAINPLTQTQSPVYPSLTNYYKRQQTWEPGPDKELPGIEQPHHSLYSPLLLHRLSCYNLNRATDELWIMTYVHSHRTIPTRILRQGSEGDALPSFPSHGPRILCVIRRTDHGLSTCSLGA